MIYRRCVVVLSMYCALCNFHLNSGTSLEATIGHSTTEVNAHIDYAGLFFLPGLQAHLAGSIQLLSLQIGMTEFATLQRQHLSALGNIVTPMTTSLHICQQ